MILSVRDFKNSALERNFINTVYPTSWIFSMYDEKKNKQKSKIYIYIYYKKG